MRTCYIVFERTRTLTCIWAGHPGNAVPLLECSTPQVLICAHSAKIAQCMEPKYKVVL